MNALEKTSDFQKAKIALESQDYLEALGYLTNVIEISGNDTERQVAYRNRGVVYGILGEYEKAIDNLTTAWDLSGNKDLAALSNRAMAYKDMGNFEKSVADCISVLEMGGTEMPQPYYCLAEIYVKTGPSEKAMENYLKALQAAIKQEDETLTRVILERVKNIGLLTALSPLIENNPSVFTAQ